MLDILHPAVLLMYVSHEVDLLIFKRMAVNILVEFLTSAANEPKSLRLLNLHANHNEIWG